MSQAVESTQSNPVRTTRRTRSGGRGYLPGLDGLRAIAVVSVCLFHFSVPGMAGGFLGVDVFFVLSGYLITSQLWTRWSDGPVQMWPFWEARIRRLFPAVGVVLLVTSLAMVLWDPRGVRSYLGDLAAAATYTSNWWYVLDARSYAAEWGLERPAALQHLWSLAVEEQFYLVWPLVIAGGIALTRGMPRREAARKLAVPVLLLALASMACMGLGSSAAHVPDPLNPSADPMRWYFGTDSHSMGLLLGASLALWRGGAGFGRTKAGAPLPRLVPTPALTAALGVAALLTLCSLFVVADYYDVWLYRWGFALVALLTMFVVSVATRPGTLAMLLSGRVMRYLGTRSYSIYLWHWPLTVFTRPGQDLHWPWWAVLVLRVVATLALSELSYRYVEVPVRKHGFRAAVGWLRARWLAVPAAVATFGVLGTTVAVGATVEPPRAEDAITQDLSQQTFDDEVVVPDEPVPTETPTPPSPAPDRPGATTAVTTASPTTRPSPTTKPRPVSTRTLRLTAYGDSFIVGATPGLAKVFRSIDSQAAVSRQSWEILPQVIEDAAANRRPADVVLIHTGNNGMVDEAQLRKALNSLAGVKRVVVTLPWTPKPWTTQARQVITKVCGTPTAPKIKNVRVGDWASLAEAHQEYMIADHVHPNPTGVVAYTKVVQVAAVRP